MLLDLIDLLKDVMGLVQLLTILTMQLVLVRGVMLAVKFVQVLGNVHFVWIILRQLVDSVLLNVELTVLNAREVFVQNVRLIIIGMVKAVNFSVLQDRPHLMVSVSALQVNF